MEQLFEGSHVNSGDRYEKGVYYEAELHGFSAANKLLFKLGDKWGIMDSSEFSVLNVNMGAIKQLRGKKLGFYVTSECSSYYTLSRKAVQQQYLNENVSKLKAGDIVDGRVCNVTDNYCFVELGYGYTCLLLLENACVAHTTTLTQLFEAGMSVKLLVKQGLNRQNKLSVSMKELLGTWSDNINDLGDASEEQEGYITRVTDYGAYVLLRPNLFGLTADTAVVRYDLHAGDFVTCKIRKVKEDKAKVILDVVENKGKQVDFKSCFKLNYYIEDREVYPVWNYSPNKVFRADV